MLSIRSAELEAAISEVRSKDEYTALRKLLDKVKTLRSELKAARHLAEDATEAAGKCQVQCMTSCTTILVSQEMTEKRRIFEVSSPTISRHRRFFCVSRPKYQS